MHAISSFLGRNKPQLQRRGTEIVRAPYKGLSNLPPSIHAKLAPYTRHGNLIHSLYVLRMLIERILPTNCSPSMLLLSTPSTTPTRAEPGRTERGSRGILREAEQDRYVNTATTVLHAADCALADLNREGVVRRGIQRVSQTSWSFSVSGGQLDHDALYCQLSNSHAHCAVLTGMTSGRRRPSQLRSSTSRARRMRSKISNKRFRSSHSSIHPMSRSTLLSSLSSADFSLCCWLQISWLVPQRVKSLDCHGVRSTPLPLPHLFSYLTNKTRYCSGGSCSDLVSLFGDDLIATDQTS